MKKLTFSILLFLCFYTIVEATEIRLKYGRLEEVYNGPIRSMYFYLNSSRERTDDYVSYFSKGPYRYNNLCEICDDYITPKSKDSICSKQINRYKLSGLCTFNNYGKIVEKIKSRQKLMTFDYNQYKIKKDPILSEVKVTNENQVVFHRGNDSASIVYDESGRLTEFIGKNNHYILKYNTKGKLSDFEHYEKDVLANSVKLKFYRNGEPKRRTEFTTSYYNYIIQSEDRPYYGETHRLLRYDNVNQRWRIHRLTKYGRKGKVLEDNGHTEDGFSCEFDENGKLKEVYSNCKKHKFLPFKSKEKVERRLYDYSSGELSHFCYEQNDENIHLYFDQYGNKIEDERFIGDSLVEGRILFIEYFDEYNYRTECDSTYMNLVVDSLVGSVSGHDYVDLGLPSSTLWATSNIGAEMPIENGTQFSWGEVKEKKEYLEDNYYSPDKTLNSSSFCGLKRLALNEDAAAVNWGGAWRMPTKVDFQELLDYCRWEHYVDYMGTGLCFYKVVGPNGKFIILKEKDFREGEDAATPKFWTANCSDSSVPIIFSLDSIKLKNLDAYKCASIRPVIHKYKHIADWEPYRRPDFKYPSDLQLTSYVDAYEPLSTSYPKQDSLWNEFIKKRQTLNTEYVDLGLSVLWAKCNLGASTPEGLGSYYSYNGKRIDRCKSFGFDKDSTFVDMAKLQLGDPWFTPGENEVNELLKKCDCFKEGNGYRVVSKVPGYTDKSLFFPLRKNERNSSGTIKILTSKYKLCFGVEYSYDVYYFYISLLQGFDGSIRPVRKKK